MTTLSTDPTVRGRGPAFRSTVAKRGDARHDRGHGRGQRSARIGQRSVHRRPRRCRRGATDGSGGTDAASGVSSVGEVPRSADDRSASTGPAGHLGPPGSRPPVSDLRAPRAVAERDGQVERARRAIDQVRGHAAQRRHRARNAAEAGLRAARLSAAIDGVPLSASTASVSPVLVGAVRAGAALPDLVGAWQRSPRQVLARIHLLATAGAADDEHVGRPRADATAVAAVNRVSALVLTGGRPAPHLVALVHRELLVAAPFATANGMVARAAARLTMMATGLDPDGLTVPEIAYLRWFRPDFPTRPVEWSEDHWIRQTIDALIEGAREAMTIADTAI